MINAISNEISISPLITGPDELMNSVYFGGGTPSLLYSSEISTLMNAVKDRFNLAPDVEITLEANPDDIDEEKLQTWKAAGINRLSIGLQSFNDAELQWMNRAHNAAQSLHCLELIRKAGFTNYSIDLIYGSPLLTDEQWQKNVATVIGLKVPHISCYALTVETGTALHSMIGTKKKEAVDPDKQASQFLLLIDWMKAAGYEHYEISNFALPGMRSRHNSSYWSGESYYGFGPSAHAFNGSTRSWNIANNALYIKSLENGIVPAETETLTPGQQLNEYVMTALRKMEGIDLAYVAQKFSKASAEMLLSGTEKWVNTGKLLISDDRITLTREGKLFADGIAADLFA